MKDTESLVMTIEPEKIGRHIKYKITMFWRDEEGKDKTETFTSRGQQSAATSIYQRLQIVNLLGVKGKMPELTPPPHATQVEEITSAS